MRNIEIYRKKSMGTPGESEYGNYFFDIITSNLVKQIK